jgi:hypothetical protein
MTRSWRAVLVLGLLGLVPVLSTEAGAVASPPSRFVPMSPVRLVDTRPGGPTADGLGSGSGKLPPNTARAFPIGGRVGIPMSATAVVLNVTAIEATGRGYVQVFPTNQAAIGASSNLNLETVGQTIPNLVTVPLGVGGQVSVYTQGGAHFAIDAFGYFVPSGPASAGRYQAVAPSRIMDTRSGLGVELPNPGNVVDCPHFARWSDANFFFWRYKALGYGDVTQLDGDNDNIRASSSPATRASRSSPPTSTSSPRPKPAP